MKGELDIHQYPSKKYRCEVWTVTLYQWAFPLDNERRRIVNAVRKMKGFVGWCDPKMYFCDRRGMVYFALFDNEENAKSAILGIHEKFPKQCIVKGTYKHYAARDPIEHTGKADDNDAVSYADFLITHIGRGGTKDG